MSFSETIDDLAPYMQADYWDGHWPQDGDLHAYEYQRMSMATSRFVRGSLQGYLQRVQRRFPLDGVRQGEVFDPAEYELGTIVAFGREALTAPVDEFLPQLHQPTPVKEPAMRPGILDFIGETRFIHVGDVAYRRGPAWGVVARSRGGKPCLARPVNSLVDMPGTPHARVRGPLTVEHTPFVVGDVAHLKIQGTRHETLRRITNLEICAPGRPKRESRRWFVFLGRFATGSAHA